MSFIKGGLVYADRLTTVSPSYAQEIQTPEFGYGLDGLLRYRSDHLTGILNGIDTRIWNPTEDPYLDFHYDFGQIENKTQCKARLQQQLGLERTGAPLFGFIGRLVEQKGIDWILAVLPGLLDRGCQIAILGSGEPRYADPLRALAHRHPGQLSLTLGYDEPLAHRITAGADLFLMPSRFEPCGLNQMYSLRYGTVPVVHAVGGLRDTVRDYDDAGAAKATGFCFRQPGPGWTLAGRDPGPGRLRQSQGLASPAAQRHGHRPLLGPAGKGIPGIVSGDPEGSLQPPIAGRGPQQETPHGQGDAIPPRSPALDPGGARPPG